MEDLVCVKKKSGWIIRVKLGTGGVVIVVCVWAVQDGYRERGKEF